MCLKAPNIWQALTAIRLVGTGEGKDGYGPSTIHCIVLFKIQARRNLPWWVETKEQSDERPSLDASDIGSEQDGKEEDADAPEAQRVDKKTVVTGLALSIVLCVATIHIVFGDLVPLYATIVAVFMALVLSIMGVRALGETDLNPVSGISKLAQLFFAFIITRSFNDSS